MKLVIGMVVYLAIAAANTAVFEKIFDADLDEFAIRPTLCGLIWPFAAPFLFAKYAVAKLLEEVEKNDPRRR